MDELRRIARRRMIIAGVFGVALMVFMFFAGKMFRSNMNSVPGSSVVVVDSRATTLSGASAVVAIPCDVNLFMEVVLDLENTATAGKL